MLVLFDLFILMTSIAEHPQYQTASVISDIQ